LIEQLVRAPDRDPAIDFAVEAFSSRDAAWTVGDVIAELGLSAKSFIKRFSERVGITPKRFARVQRFQHVLTDLEGKSEVSWTEVAHRVGYYDQAHFTHDFRAFAGITPSEYFAKRRHKNHVLP
jgi:AraC-like DNA-binding protein